MIYHFKTGRILHKTHDHALSRTHNDLWPKHRLLNPIYQRKKNCENDLEQVQPRHDLERFAMFQRRKKFWDWYMDEMHWQSNSLLKEH